MTDIKLDDYQDEGLYLISNSGVRLNLTKKRINDLATKYWSDPNKIPDMVKNAAKFQKCTVCPAINEPGFCDAIKPVFPLLEVIDQFTSTDEITAIYKSDKTKICHVVQTTMQEALKYVTTLSLIQYCEIGRKYMKYYWGIIPLENAPEIAAKFYLNLFIIYNGDKEKINKIIEDLREELMVTTQC